jgi:hypothetical protein
MTNDEPIVIGTDKPLRLSADTMRALKKATGRNMSELLNDDDDDANRIQVVAFAELFRRYLPSGHTPDAAALWEEAGAAEVDFTAPEPIDPLGGGFSQTSPPSVGTGE